MKGKKRLASFLLVCMLVATSLVLVLPLNAPEVKADVVHLGSTMAEDWAGGSPNIYDMDPTPYVVFWDPNENHTINTDYIVNPDYTLIIPALNYINGTTMSEHWVGFSENIRITVQAGGTLITNTDGDSATKTPFIPLGSNWDGIYFEAGGQGCIQDCLFQQSTNGVQFEPDSILKTPGITGSKFEEYGNYGVKIDGSEGYTNVHDNVEFTSDTGIGLEVLNGQLNITNTYPNTITFTGHGDGLSCLHIVNSEVTVGPNTYFNGKYTIAQPGNCVHIENNTTPNSTVITENYFYFGYPGDYYIGCDGASPLIVSPRFELGTNATGTLTLIGNENASGAPSHPILRDPINMSNPAPFHNSTCEATGSSSVSIQWYLDVYVIDPHDNPIGNAPVWVYDRLANPAEPPYQLTDNGGDIGWARDFVVTELIIYNDSKVNFNPFNISAMNNSMVGYAISPDNIINVSKEVTVTVPFMVGSNTPPIVSYIYISPGILSGNITIEYMLHDPDPEDNGSLSVEVLFSKNGGPEFPASPAPESDPTTGLFSDTLYVFIWDSQNLKDLPNGNYTTVYIKIIPYDKAGVGIPSQIGPFTVDNTPPPPPTPSPPKKIGAKLVAGGKDVMIFWNASDDDGKGENDVEGYTVYKSFTGVNGIYDFAAWIKANGSASYNWSDIDTGDGNPNNYFYIVRANDTLDIEEQNINKVGKFVYPLEKDWNLISIPLIQTNTSRDNVLQTIVGNYTGIYAYHAGKSRPWLHWHNTKPAHFNDVFDINHRDGYYIRMLNPDYLVVAGKVPTNAQIDLKTGWNLVGYPCLVEMTRDDAISSISHLHPRVSFYNTTSGKEEELAPDDIMSPGIGYWIHVKAACVWELPF